MTLVTRQLDENGQVHIDGELNTNDSKINLMCDRTIVGGYKAVE